MAGSGKPQRRPTVDDLRTAWHAQAPNDRSWIREVHLDPLELIISDDTDGTTKRVPVTVSASGAIHFGQPRRVRVEYVPADETTLDESTLVYASAADSRAGNGTHVYATYSRKEPAAMAQPQQSTKWPGDQPRQPGEDLLAWGIRTGRIAPGGNDERTWSEHIAASASAAEHVLQVMAPGCARAVTTSGGAYGLVRAAAPPAVADRRWYRANPLVDDMREQSPNVYRDAATHGGPTPTLFGSGDLPAMTSSGLDPAVLRGLPWPARHPIAAAATADEAEDLIQQVAEMGADFSPVEFMAHEGNADYRMRVQSWGMRAIDAAAEHRRGVAAAAQLQLSQVDASSTPAVGDLDDDELYDRVFGHSDRQAADRHVEHLRSIVAGRTVATGVSQRQARTMLEEYARGNQIAASVPGNGMPRGSRIPIPADLARSVLTQLDRELSGRWVS